MSTKELAPYVKAIEGVKDDFERSAGSLLRYNDESIFAMQALMKTDFAMSTANANPKSVHLAMRNVAATGLTLNPANGYAYLVPRDKSIMLDISYKGLIKIATDSGAILWARADLVREGDDFTYNGPAMAPIHCFDPFKRERENVPAVGVYCIAKTKDGDILTEIMPMAELEKIRDKSTAYTRGSEGKKGPWVDFFEQMAKKAVIKRASKTWPYTKSIERLHEAIAIANESEGGYELEAAPERITPRGGVYEALDAETKQKVTDASIIVREYFDNDDPLGAHDYIQRLGFGAEEQVALFDKLTAPMRTALKVAASTAKKLEHAA